jgi:hypothetical protein
VIPLWLHLLGCVGFVFVVTQSKATACVRRVWPDMLSCSLCFGVWAGAAWGALLLARPVMSQWACASHEVASVAFAVSLLAYAAQQIVCRLELPHAPE